jgi:hypothetical protein
MPLFEWLDIYGTDSREALPAKCGNQISTNESARPRDDNSILATQN